MDFAQFIRALPSTAQHYAEWPSPLAGRDFDPNDLMRGAVNVPNAGFEDHAFRHPPEFEAGPSRRPGVDYDVTYPTEKLQVHEKPVVTSPVSGRIVGISESVGGIGIEDKNGWVHWVLHMHLHNLGPLTRDLFVSNNGAVRKGDLLGMEGNVGASADHVHIWVRSPHDGKLYDIENLLIGREGEITGIKDVDKAEFDKYIQSDEMRRTIMEFYREQRDAAP